MHDDILWSNYIKAYLDTAIENDEFVIEGHFCKPNLMSDSLRRRLIQYGVPQNKLNRFLKGADEA
jgi:hypothetical protein